MAKNKVKANDPKLQADIASFKASLAFIIFCFIIFLTASNLENNRELYRFRYDLDTKLWWLLLIPVALLAVSAVLKIRAIRSNKDESFSYFSTSDFLGLASLFTVYSLTFASTNNIVMYSIVVVGFAIAYYVKRFFGTDFYAVTLMNLAIAFGLWLIFGNKGWQSTLSTTATLILFIACAITGILALLFVISAYLPKCALLSKALCAYGICDKDATIAKSTLVPAIISIVFGVALAGILLFAPALMTLLVAEIVLLIQYLALGIYYTVRLINQ